MNFADRYPPFPAGYVGAYKARRGTLSTIMAFGSMLDVTCKTDYWTGTVPASEGYVLSGKPGAVAYRHRGRANVAMYDGHLERQPVAELVKTLPWSGW